MIRWDKFAVSAHEERHPNEIGCVADRSRRSPIISAASIIRIVPAAAASRVRAVLVSCSLRLGPVGLRRGRSLCRFFCRWSWWGPLAPAFDAPKYELVLHLRG